MSFGALPRLFRHEAASGIVLMLALALALVLAKSRWPGSTMCCSTSRAVHIGEFGIEKPLLLWVNAGLAFADLSLSSIVEPVPLGIAAGLFLGKQTGVFGAAAPVIRRGGRSCRPASWLALYGTSILTGIGFTMSRFIGTLAFGESDPETPMRLGVLVGSALSALVGAGVLWVASQRR